MSKSERSIQELWDHHTMAVGNRDLRAFVQDFAEDCILITPQRVFRGRKEVGEWFENFMTITKDAQFASKGPVFERNVIFIKWDMESSTHTINGATDTFVVNAGLFQVVTVNIDPKPKEENHG